MEGIPDRLIKYGLPYCIDKPTDDDNNRYNKWKRLGYLKPITKEQYEKLAKDPKKAIQMANEISIEKEEAKKTLHTPPGPKERPKVKAKAKE